MTTYTEFWLGPQLKGATLLEELPEVGDRHHIGDQCYVVDGVDRLKPGVAAISLGATLPQRGEVCRHQKGTDYLIIGITEAGAHPMGLELTPFAKCQHTEMDFHHALGIAPGGALWPTPALASPCVLYRGTHGGTLWAKPLDIFLSEKNGQPRFVKISGASSSQGSSQTSSQDGQGVATPQAE